MISGEIFRMTMKDDPWRGLGVSRRAKSEFDFWQNDGGTSRGGCGRREITSGRHEAENFKYRIENTIDLASRSKHLSRGQRMKSSRIQNERAVERSTNADAPSSCAVSSLVLERQAQCLPLSAVSSP